MEWIFDRKTHTLLGERGVQVKAPKRANTEDRLIVTFTSATTVRAVVDRVKQAPGREG